MIDLHVHLDGSLSFDIVRKLAALQNMKQYTDKELIPKMVAPKDCQNLNDYLTKFDYPLELLQTKEALELCTYELLKLQQSQGLEYSEIRFAPQLHLQNGLTQEEVVEAVLKGRQKFQYKLASTNGQSVSESGVTMQSGIILCCMRGADDKQNYKTIEVASEYKDKGITLIDLAGAEALFPTKNYKELFRYAESLKIPYTIHAGEADGPESIWYALEFGARRIGHGVRCTQDKELMKRLMRDQIPLELCPTSNLNTKIFEKIEDYPIPELLDAGIKITINTDNMTVSDTTLARELKLVQETFRLSEEEMAGLQKNAKESIIF